MIKKGYYLVYFKSFGRDPKKTFAYNDGSDHYPWSLIGSDEIFGDSEVEVIKKIDIDSL